MKIAGTQVNIGDVEDYVYEYGRDLSTYDPKDITDYGCDDPGGDIRLQVHNGWMIHTGDSQFDQDHRGYWGSEWVPAGCTRAQAREIARDLVGGAADHEAM